MKYELVEWFDIELVFAWVWVQTLEGSKWNSIFAIFSLVLNLKG